MSLTNKVGDVINHPKHLGGGNWVVVSVVNQKLRGSVRDINCEGDIVAILTLRELEEDNTVDLLKPMIRKAQDTTKLKEEDVLPYITPIKEVTFTKMITLDI